MTIFDWLWNVSLIAFGWFLYDLTTTFWPTTNPAPKKYIGLVGGMALLLMALRTAPEIHWVVMLEHATFAGVWVYAFWYRYYSVEK